MGVLREEPQDRGALFQQVWSCDAHVYLRGIGNHLTWDDKAVVVECGSGTNIAALYRARVFQRDQDVVRAMERPDIEIGPPPPARAMAGRMNARGIAVFYGALDAATAVAE